MSSLVSVPMTLLCKALVIHFFAWNDALVGLILGSWDGVFVHQSWLEDRALEPLSLTQIICGICFDFYYRNTVVKSIFLLFGILFGALLSDVGLISSAGESLSGLFPSLRDDFVDEDDDISLVSDSSYTSEILVVRSHKSPTTRSGRDSRLSSAWTRMSSPQTKYERRPSLPRLFIPTPIRQGKSPDRRSRVTWDDGEVTPKARSTHTSSQVYRQQQQRESWLPASGSYIPPLSAASSSQSVRVYGRSADSSPVNILVIPPDEMTPALSPGMDFQVPSTPSILRAGVNGAPSTTPPIPTIPEEFDQGLPTYSSDPPEASPTSTRNSFSPSDVRSSHSPVESRAPSRLSNREPLDGGVNLPEIDQGFGAFDDELKDINEDNYGISIDAEARSARSNSPLPEIPVKLKDISLGEPPFSWNFPPLDVPPDEKDPDDDAELVDFADEVDYVSVGTVPESILPRNSKNSLVATAEQFREQAIQATNKARELQASRALAERSQRWSEVFSLKFQIEEQEELAKKLNAKAQRRFQAAHNVVEHNDTIDVHGLKVAEATRVVDIKLRQLQLRGAKHLRVIVGRGIHSRGGKPVLKPAIREHMERQHFTVVGDKKNPGVLHIHLP